MPTCPLCTLEHDFIHRSATTNEVLPGDCIKALHALVQGGPMPYHRERDAKLEELAARIEPLEARVESLRSRVAKLEDAAAAPYCQPAPPDAAAALEQSASDVKES